LTAETRAYLRTQIDLVRRVEIDKHRKAYVGKYCTGCGTSHDNYTRDCPTCTDRRHRRAKAAEKRAHDIRLARRRAGLCTRCCRPVDDHTPVTKTECVNCWDRQRQRRYKEQRA